MEYHHERLEFVLGSWRRLVIFMFDFRWTVYSLYPSVCVVTGLAWTHDGLGRPLRSLVIVVRDDPKLADAVIRGKPIYYRTH